MKAIFKKNWVSIYVIVFAVLCIVASYTTSDNIYNPALENEKQRIVSSKLEKVDEVTDILTLQLEGVDESNNTLLFYSNHQEIYVYIENELVYSLEKADSIFGRTPGAMWNIITLPLGTEELQVKVIQVYPSLAKQKLEFELGSAISMYHEIMNNSALELILTFAIILIGLALLAYWTLVFCKVNKQRELLYLGLFALIFGIWNFGETQFAVFMFDNRAFWSYLAFTCLMTMCLPAVYFFREFLETEDKYVHRIIVFYIVGETIVAQLLHMTGIAGVKETANYTIVSIVLVLVYLLIAIVMGIKRKKNMKKIIVNIVGMCILVATAVIDISSYFTNILTAVKVAKVGFLVYTVILGVETTRIARERLQEEQKMEILKEMAVKDLLTGCYNRNAFSEDVSEIIDKTGIQIIGFDLNDLKKCNDTKGHKAGDQYIANAARMICDIFGKFGKVYRVGGDEFCVITQNVTEEQFLERREALKVAIEHYRLDHPNSGFGIACGYATYDAKLDDDLEETRHRADIKMYENKKEVKR